LEDAEEDLTAFYLLPSEHWTKLRSTNRYVTERILDVSPFATIDEPGVGELVRTAVRLGRLGSADIELGVCGEHGGDPASIRFFHRVGLDYVSCSPFRLPIARVAAAQAAIASVPPTP
jgi:pyruvate, orthophosphate dikinase